MQEIMDVYVHAKIIQWSFQPKTTARYLLGPLHNQQCLHHNGQRQGQWRAHGLLDLTATKYIGCRLQKY